MNKQIIEKIKKALTKDPELLCDRDTVAGTFGHNPDYLLDVHSITKSELIRLERGGLAVKARYATENNTPRGKLGVTGPHRVRWLIFKEVLGG